MSRQGRNSILNLRSREERNTFHFLTEDEAIVLSAYRHLSIFPRHNTDRYICDILDDEEPLDPKFAARVRRELPARHAARVRTGRRGRSRCLSARRHRSTRQNWEWPACGTDIMARQNVISRHSNAGLAALARNRRQFTIGAATACAGRVQPEPLPCYFLDLSRDGRWPNLSEYARAKLA
jgi:hypothetical protein